MAQEYDDLYFSKKDRKKQNVSIEAPKTSANPVFGTTNTGGTTTSGGTKYSNPEFNSNPVTPASGGRYEYFPDNRFSPSTTSQQNWRTYNAYAMSSVNTWNNPFWYDHVGWGRPHLGMGWNSWGGSWLSIGMTWGNPWGWNTWNTWRGACMSCYDPFWMDWYYPTAWTYYGGCGSCWSGCGGWVGSWGSPCWRGGMGWAWNSGWGWNTWNSWGWGWNAWNRPAVVVVNNNTYWSDNTSQRRYQRVTRMDRTAGNDGFNGGKIIYEDASTRRYPARLRENNNSGNPNIISNERTNTRGQSTDNNYYYRSRPSYDSSSGSTNRSSSSGWSNDSGRSRSSSYSSGSNSSFGSGGFGGGRSSGGSGGSSGGGSRGGRIR